MLTHVRKRDVLLVRLEGELDQCSASGIRRDIDALLQDPSVRHLVLDMARMPFMDSSGIGLILGRHKLISAMGGVVVVQKAPKDIKRMLSIAGIESKD
mgnify:CR=1 FL=1